MDQGLLIHYQASLVAQWQRTRLSMQETWVQSLGWDDPLEKEMATHSSILAWRIQWIEEPGRLPPWGHKESDRTEQLNNNSKIQYDFIITCSPFKDPINKYSHIHRFGART